MCDYKYKTRTIESGGGRSTEEILLLRDINNSKLNNDLSYTGTDQLTLGLSIREALLMISICASCVPISGLTCRLYELPCVHKGGRGGGGSKGEVGGDM